MSVPMLEDEIVGICDEVLEMGLLIRRRRNLVLPTVTCDKSHIVCDNRDGRLCICGGDLYHSIAPPSTAQPG